MARERFTTEESKKGGKKSSRKGIENVKTAMMRWLIERRNERAKSGEPPLTMEDLKKESPLRWLWLTEHAETLQEVLLVESHLSKYLHTEKKEFTGDLVTAVNITIVEGDKE